MSFFTDHLERIVTTYKGDIPLPAFLRSYFRQYPKLGSRDRRSLTEAAFIYYRCKSFYPSTRSVTGIVAQGYSLCNSTNIFLHKMLGETPTEHHVLPDMNSAIVSPLSEGMDREAWLRSMWQQPGLFIRIRKNKDRILSLLRENNIDYDMAPVPGNPDQDCLMLPNGSPVDKIFPEDAYVVQDWASQASIYQVNDRMKAPAQVWDVCSGAGGKSILLKDKWPSFQLLASDIRESILHNLKMRFRLYDLDRVRTVVVNSADKTAVKEHIGDRKFDLVLCDVPCSGSGTWARSPEQFHFFKDADLLRFGQLQYPIAFNASAYLAEGGTLAYITCSVFRQENENVVNRLLETTDLSLEHQQLINGIPNKADSMFVAVFKKKAGAQ